MHIHVQERAAAHWPPAWKRARAPPHDRVLMQLVTLTVNHRGRPRWQEGTNVPGPVSIVELYGVTRSGHRACIEVHGFLPYFYVEPYTYRTDLTEAEQRYVDGNHPDEPVPPDDMADVRTRNERASASRGIMATRWAHQPQEVTYACNERLMHRDDAPPLVVDCTVVEACSMYGYAYGETRPFLRVVCRQPSCVPTVKRHLRWHGVDGTRFVPYEADVPFELRFLIDARLQCGGWLHAPSTTVHWKEVQPSPEHNNDVAPLRTMSVDIECVGREGQFPDADEDPVIMIACAVRTTGGGEEGCAFDVVLLLGKGCSALAPPLHDAARYTFDREIDLLTAWNALVTHCDADVVTGYNLDGFDLKYLYNRSRKLQLGTAWFDQVVHDTKGGGTMRMPTRAIVDPLPLIKGDTSIRLRSHTLNHVSEHFLGERKADVHYSQIGPLMQGTDADRAVVAFYCLKDAVLPLRLLDKLMLLTNVLSMGQVTGVPIDMLLQSGQTIKVFALLLAVAARRHADEGDPLKLVPTRIRDRRVPVTEAKKAARKPAAYTGATVIEPKTGFHDACVTTLDFASLYPTIMMARNLCYTTLLPTPAAVACARDNQDDLFQVEGTRHAYVRSYRGILPQIVEELLARRKEAKKAMAAAQDPMKRAVLNGKQLALKITANSVYGFTGAAEQSRLPCVEVSADVTACGRDMILHTKAMVEREYPDAEVIYGDTDSVMVKFQPEGTDDVKEAQRLGEEAAQRITATFPPPILLEYECVAKRFLLLKKKRYAALGADGKLLIKGIESVRRDNCPLVGIMQMRVLELILRERDVQGAVRYVQNQIRKLLCGEVDMAHLVISKSLSREPTHYAGKQAHAELTIRMRKRDPGTAPKVGDRVPYVIVRMDKKARVCDKTEDPLYALQHAMPLDYDYYVHQQLEKPLLRIFSDTLPHAERALFQGPHMRHVVRETPRNHALSRWTHALPTCASCRVVLRKRDSAGKEKTALCDACTPRTEEIRARLHQDWTQRQEACDTVWKTCADCQGELADACANRECNLFYYRHQVRHQARKADETLQRF